MTAIDHVRKLTLVLYKYVVRERNRERKDSPNLPSSPAIEAYLTGTIDAYSTVLKNLRYYNKKEKAYERVER